MKGLILMVVIMCLNPQGGYGVRRADYRRLY